MKNKFAKWKQKQICRKNANRTQILQDNTTDKQTKKKLLQKITRNLKNLLRGNNAGKKQISLKHGERCLDIASLNYDDIRSKQRIIELLVRLDMQKVDIACIQETHNITQDYYED